MRPCALVLTALAAAAPAAAADEPVATTADPPPSGAGAATTTGDPADGHQLTVGGYLQPQLRLRQDDPRVGLDEDGFRVRRARLELGDRRRFGRLAVEARLEAEVASAVELEDGWVAADGCLVAGGHWRLALGQQKAPVSRQALLSDARLGFVEKPELAQLAPERQLGLAGALDVPHAGWLRLHAGLFDGEGKNQGGNVDQRFLWAGRLEVRPLGRDVGLAESVLGGDYLVAGVSAAQNRVAAGTSVERTRTFGGDVAFGWRGLSGAIEYLEVRHARRDGGTPDFRANGVVFQLAYLVPLPGRWARHLELGARLDEIDRNDTIPIERAGDAGQSLRSYHAAATWYQHGHDLKLQVDAAHVVEVEAITRYRTDATYRNDTVLVQATYRLEGP